MAIDHKKIDELIEENEEQEKLIVVERHNLAEIVENATSQLKQVDKRLHGTRGIIEALKFVKAQMDDSKTPDAVEVGGWGKGEPVV